MYYVGWVVLLENEGKRMRGVGGPLLCIGDLLSDVDESNSINVTAQRTPFHLPDSNLATLFQEHYQQLNKALSGTDHSWTTLTFKTDALIESNMREDSKIPLLCTALEMANKLILSTSSNNDLLLEKVEELKRIINRRDAAIEAVKGIEGSVEHS